MFCPNCGAQIADNALFCPACGQPCAANQQAAAPNPFAQPGAQPPYQPQQDAQQAYQAWQQPAQQPYQDYQQPQQAYQQPTQQAWQQDAQQDWQQQPAYQQPAAPVTAKKRSPKKGIFIGLGCLLLAALIGGGIWFLTSRKGGSSPVEKLMAPAEKSLASLSSYVEDLPNLHTIVENVEQLGEAEGLHMAMKMVNQYAYGTGDNREVYGTNIDVALDMNQAAGKTMLSGTYSSNGTNIPFTLYLDKDQLRAASSALLDEDEAVVIPLDNLVQRWNGSALAKLTDITLPEDLDLSGITDADPEEGLKSVYGENWEKFMESVDLVPYTGTPYFTGSGETRTLTWDKATLQAMYNQTDLDLEDLGDIDDLDDLSRIDLSGLTAKAIVAALGEADKVLQEVQVYTEDDQLLGLYVKAAPEGEDPAEFVFRLLGEQNPWEHISCTGHRSYGSYTTDDTVDILLRKTQGQLRLEITATHDDSDGAEYSYTEGPYALVYNDADGRITYEEEGEVKSEGDFRLLPAEGGFTFVIESSEESEYYSYLYNQAVTFSGQAGSISVPGTKTIDLLSLSEQELQDLMTRIGQKAQSIN